MDNHTSVTPNQLPANETLESFLSSATHQLRSPLTTMSWTLDLLLKNLETEPPDKLRHKLEVINHSTHNLIDLVNDMLTVAHLNQEHFVQEKQPVTLSALLSSIIDELKPQAEAKPVTVALTIPPELQSRQYLVDPKWFQLCFHNVIANAIRYSNPGGQVQIIVTAQNDQVCIAISDQGIGISAADQTHIFEKFFRGQNVHNESEAGSGLGLFISRSIAQRWGGDLTISSQENQGTTATVCLPLEVVS